MRIAVINRWTDEFAQYHNYIDHKKHQVGYITTKQGLKWLQQDTPILTQDNLNDFNLLLNNVREISNFLGGIDLLIAMAESDLITAAKLREILNIPGLKVSETEVLKDKVMMKDKVRQSGVKTPSYIDCKSKEHILSFISQIGYPLILKPKREAACRGVYKVCHEEELKRIIDSIDLSNYECEEFIKGNIYHVDGVILNNSIKFIKASKYINTCLDFKYGKPVGSVVSDNKKFNKTIFILTERILTSLSLFSGIFHLELIVSDSGIYFLEIGARMGGGETCVIIRDVYGINLAECWTKIQLNEPIPEISQNDNEYAGIILFPEPLNTPCIVEERSSLKDKIPFLYKETLPKIGQIMDGQGGYDEISGKFLFRGPSTSLVEKSIRLAITSFYIKAKDMPR